MPEGGFESFVIAETPMMEKPLYDLFPDIKTYSGFSLNDGYCMPGNIPTFQIFDVSAGIYLEAEPTEDIPWVNFGFPFIEGLNGCEEGYTNIDGECYYQSDLVIALDGIDLISFYALPENTSVENIFGSIIDQNPAILGEGLSAFYMENIEC